MVRETPLSNCEKEFTLTALHDNNQRVDGRGTYDFRKIKIAFGHSLGHVEVQLGRTRVLVQVSCELVRPFPERPSEGFIHFNTELSPMANPSFEAGRPSLQAVELGRIIERGLKNSRSIDIDSLCVSAGEKVWSVRVDIHVLDDGGNIIDCAALAAITALRHFRRPDVTVMGDEVTVHAIEDRNPVPLSIHHTPIAVTFGFFNDGELLVVDPARPEERVMDGRMTMTLNASNEVCALHKGGGVSLDPSQISRCARIATVKVSELSDAITSALRDDQEKRLGKKRPHGSVEDTPSRVNVTVDEKPKKKKKQCATTS